MYMLAYKILLVCLNSSANTENRKVPSVLIFLPGLYEIETFDKMLRERSNSTSSDQCFDYNKYKVCVLHSSLSPDDQRLAFQSTSVSKIILATNIAESSVTIPDVTHGKVIIELSKHLNDQT